MTKHPWHEAEHFFERESCTVRGIVEIPRGSKAKYEVDKKTGLLKLDRVIFAAFVYPVNYGFIPQTLGEDGDPLDILVLSEVSIAPLCLVDTRILGYMEMFDNGERDEKIIAVAKGDMSVCHLESIDSLPENFKSELVHFFSNYKTLMGKEVKTGSFANQSNALEVVQQSIDRYKTTFK